MTSNDLPISSIPNHDVLETNDDTMNPLDDQPLINVDNHGNSSRHKAIRIPAIFGVRVTNLLRILIFIEFIVLLTLWLTSGTCLSPCCINQSEVFISILGNDNRWLINDIIHFHFTTSTFDLVILALCKLILLIIVLTELETRVIIGLYRPMIRSKFSYIRSISISILMFITIGTFIFSIIKLIFVLRNLQLNRLNLSCVYIFLAFSSLELIGSLRILPYLTQLKLLDQQQSSDPTEKSVNISRVLSLAKAERSLILTGTLFLLISSSTQIVNIIYYGRIIGGALGDESTGSINRNIIIVLCIDFVGSVAGFLYVWLYELAGQ